VPPTPIGAPRVGANGFLITPMLSPTIT